MLVKEVLADLYVDLVNSNDSYGADGDNLYKCTYSWKQLNYFWMSH